MGNHLYDILDGGKHLGAIAARVGDADGAVGACLRPCLWAPGGDAGELVVAVIRRRLSLIEVVETVIALELRIDRQRMCCTTVVLSVVLVKIIRCVLQGEVKGVSSRACLSRAIHIRNAIGPETLRPIIPAAGLGRIHQLEPGCSITTTGSLLQISPALSPIPP